MNKEEMEKLYKEIGDRKISDLYAYSCLLTSGFDKEQAFNLYDLLTSLWLKDENEYCFSKLSDMLYRVYDFIKDEIDNMSAREILIKMYQYE